MLQENLKVKEKLQNCYDADKHNYKAKVEYIYATMNAILEAPMQEIDNIYLRFIYDTFDRAKELNKHD